jgi:hypothetical protein
VGAGVPRFLVGAFGGRPFRIMKEGGSATGFGKKEKRKQELFFKKK